ncbi:LysR family transcriptional regulator [Roseateles sp. LYH14W]|uniref:LysR family transcriptional regulator n=1 Tax=Pelomonas parva TaxID=3299032 RepID=A0ABW7F1L2_9BURK
MNLDWNHWQVFLALAEGGSTAAAARALGQTQPTLSRQLAALEAAAGLALFERHPRGLRLTAAGQELLPAACRMREAAQGLSLALAARDTSLAGTVRLTASEIVSAHFLPAALVPLRAAHPEIQIELVASNALEDLLARSADLAVRMTRPTEPALLTRRLADWPLGLYAHHDYLARHGMPTPATLAEHVWLGHDRSTQLIDGFRAGGVDVDREFFAWRCDNQLVNWEALRAGLGIGVGLRALAARDAALVPVLPEFVVPPLPLWLAAHRELRDTPRLRLVFEALVTAWSAGPA